MKEMTLKRTLALLAALLMLVTLFAGCSNDTADTGTTDDSSDAPAEDGLISIFWIGTGDGVNYQKAVGCRLCKPSPPERNHGIVWFPDRHRMG